MKILPVLGYTLLLVIPCILLLIAVVMQLMYARKINRTGSKLNTLSANYAYCAMACSALGAIVLKLVH